MAQTSKTCDFGWKAVDAELVGTDNKMHRLFAYKGSKGLVIVFICNHCPYVQAVINKIVRDANDLSAHGINFVSISSNDVIKYPEDSFYNMIEFAKKHDFPFPYLYDETQEVAKDYGAVCTPDFFGFDANLELQYRGRLDSTRKEATPLENERDLYNAMVMIANTGHGPKKQSPTIGCGIKWKE